MKHFLYALCVLSMIAILTTSVAAYATTSEEKIANLAAANEKVVRAKCIIYKRNCLVALQTKEFTSHEQYKQFVAQLTEQITFGYEVDNVYVIRNPRAMQIMNKLDGLSQSERDKAIQRLLELVQRRSLAKPLPLPSNLRAVFE